MKKLLLITSIITAISSSAFARTQGNQIGIEYLHSWAEHQYNANGDKFDDTAGGFGLHYKYAINLDNGFFVAPGVFAEKLYTDSNDAQGDTAGLDYRYGAKVDLGYDITDGIAAYVTAGLGVLNYDVNWSSVGAKRSGNEAGLTYGAGLSFSATDNVALNLEYNFQNTDIQTPGVTKADTDLHLLKVGLAYRF